MKILPLDSKLEPLFWQHVYADVPDYYFFILDMKHDRDKTKITLALDQENCIDGMMMVYRDSVIQLRGSVEAVKSLIANLDGEKIEMTLPAEYRSLSVPSQYDVKKTFDLTLMALRKGEETSRIKYELVKLTVADAEDIAALMRISDPSWWGEVKAEQIAEGMSRRLWLGAEVDGKLVSIGSARIDEWAGCINTVATHKSFRNRGNATSVVSALVREMLEKSGLALIFVESKNLPAVRAYGNVGFEPHKEYIVIRAEKRRNEKEGSKP